LRYCDELALRLDDDIVRQGGERASPADTRAKMAQGRVRLGGARMPALADRAILADREWAERLGLDPTHRGAASLRRVYSVIFRVASAVAHPTLAGVQFVTERRPDRVTTGVEPTGHAHEAMLRVPPADRHGADGERPGTREAERPADERVLRVVDRR
jgi:hypothetical protein